LVLTCRTYIESICSIFGKTQKFYIPTLFPYFLFYYLNSDIRIFFFMIFRIFS
jgi:hypothetical protein